MSSLPPGWSVYEEGIPVPNTHVHFNGMINLITQLSQLSTGGFFNQRTIIDANTPSGVNKNYLPPIDYNDLRPFLPSFTGLNKDNTLNWIKTQENQFHQIRLLMEF